MVTANRSTSDEDVNNAGVCIGNGEGEKEMVDTDEWGDERYKGRF
jgi:hypothetical protein